MQPGRDRGANRRAQRMALTIALIVEIPMLFVAMTSSDPFAPDKLPVYGFALAISWLLHKELRRNR